MLEATYAYLKDEYVSTGEEKVSLWDLGVALELAKLGEETGTVHQ